MKNGCGSVFPSQQHSTIIATKYSIMWSQTGNHLECENILYLFPFAQLIHKPEMLFKKFVDMMLGVKSNSVINFIQ